MPRATYRPGLPALVALLLVVFAIAGGLVYEAWSTGKARTQLVERGLQDYASYATWNTARAGDNALAASLSTLFRGLTGNRVAAGEAVPDIGVLLSGAKYLQQCDCAVDVPAHYYFRYDARNGSVDLKPYVPPTRRPDDATGWAAAKVGPVTAYQAPAPVNEALERPWVAAVLDGAGDRPGAGFSVHFAPYGDSIRVIALAPQRDAAGTVIGSLGLVGSARTFADAVFSQLWSSPKILPRAITRGVPTESLLAATVSTPAGREIYRSSGWTENLQSDTASLATFAGGMVVRTALRPDATAEMRAAMAPVSRVPVWIGALILTGLLTVFLVRNLRREQELARLRLEFAASVSHELRTPLAQILLFGETLSLGRTRSESERTDAASVIVREATRLMHVVDNTLVFSRAERPVVSLRPQTVELAPLVEDVVQGFVPLASARDVRIEPDLDDRIRAFVDPGAVRQMLLNLLDNAVKYGPAGQRVRVGLAGGFEAAAAGTGRLMQRPGNRRRMIRITVEDEGPGVAGRARTEIWEPFTRGTNGQAPVGTGCGLGLAVVRELAERHNGSAWVEAAPGLLGARFVIELPQIMAEMSDADRSPPETSAVPGRSKDVAAV